MGEADASRDRMEPLERLLNLVGLLLESRRPLTFEEIRETLDAYQGDNLESAKRMFERDKDVLREYGVPLRMDETDAWGTEQGYVIRKDEYYLPEIEFSPEEITALFVAAQSGREETAVEQGVRKLVFGADGGVLAGMAGGPLVAGSDAPSAAVLAAADAAQQRRRVRFGYRTSQGADGERDVDAWGVVFRGGHWYLVGHDRDRDEVRAFRLSRITSAIDDDGEGSEPPAGFRAADHVEAGPWDASGEERASIAFDPEVAWLARDGFADAQEGGTLGDGRVVLSVPYADEGILAAAVLQYGPDAEVLGPPTVRDEVVRRLREVVDA
ncbi:MAG TPA: WYL domain-containing protein [Actinomycetota bacterium]|nr:WYL domain-containing protein [Actinomycetota bacterium]